MYIVVEDMLSLSDFEFETLKKYCKSVSITFFEFARGFNKMSICVADIIKDIQIERTQRAVQPVDYSDIRSKDRSSSYYIPFYFSISGSDRPISTKRTPLPKCKVAKNVRPKGTHSHWKFYR